MAASPHSQLPQTTHRSQKASAAVLVPITLAALAALDLFAPPEVPVAVIYTMPVLMAAWLERRRRVFLTAIVSVVLILSLGNQGVQGDLTPFMAWNLAGIATFAVGVATFFSITWVDLRRALLRSQQVQAKTLANITEGVFTIDADARIVWMNRTAAAMTGWPITEAIGQELSSVMKLEADAIMHPEGAIESGKGEVLVSRSGGFMPVEFTIAELPPEREGEGQGSVILLRNVSEQRNREGAMLRMAYRDPLTGLANRASLIDRLELELSHARRRGKFLALMFLDLDGLKAVNDSLGHDAGDALIIGFANRIKAVLRKGDTVARLAGDEFNVILPDLDDAEGAKLVAAKILGSLKEPVAHGNYKLPARVSIGIAMFPDHATDRDELMRRSDEAMYQAKAAGGQCFRIVNDSAEQNAS